MVDFNKKIINSNKFRQAALNFINTGSYCNFPESTSEYFKFWDEESKDVQMVILLMMEISLVGITIFI